MSLEIDQSMQFIVQPQSLKSDIRAFSPDFCHNPADSPTYSVTSTTSSFGSLKKTPSLDGSVSFGIDNPEAYYAYNDFIALKPNSRHSPHFELAPNPTSPIKRVGQSAVKCELPSPLPDSCYDPYPDQYSAGPASLQVSFPTPPGSDTTPPLHGRWYMKTEHPTNICTPYGYQYGYNYQPNHNRSWCHEQQQSYGQPCCPQSGFDPSLDQSVQCRSTCAQNHISFTTDINNPATFYSNANSCHSVNAAYSPCGSPYPAMQNRALHIVPPYTNDDYIIPKSEYCQDLSSTSFSSIRGVSSKANTPPRRYKCSLCIKRFTRPSSLATHMHSHTGEKPYKCSVDGCGRRFSVVSNLRRHAKIHFGNVQ